MFIKNGDLNPIVVLDTTEQKKMDDAATKKSLKCVIKSVKAKQNDTVVKETEKN